jgi:ABC-type antimicrobial peptide transport system permease subunit
MGVPSRTVLGIFLTQGLLMGLGAFAMALAVYVGGEGLFRQAAARALGLRESGFLEGWALQSDLLWLPMAVAAVALGVTLLGVWLPARCACRMKPADALRSRE